MSRAGAGVAQQEECPQGLMGGVNQRGDEGVGSEGAAADWW